MRNFLLFLVVLFATIFATNAETWTPVGQVQWTEGALTAQTFSYYYDDYYYNKTWNVSIERSDNRTGVYRLQPYASNPFSNFPYHKSDNVYLYLHTENPQAVYIEYFIYNFFTDNYNIIIVSSITYFSVAKKMALTLNTTAQSLTIRLSNFQLEALRSIN